LDGTLVYKETDYRFTSLIAERCDRARPVKLSGRT
jgi:hypothetical protein